jgi:hypothetical protein
MHISATCCIPSVPGMKRSIAINKMLVYSSHSTDYDIMESKLIYPSNNLWRTIGCEMLRFPHCLDSQLRDDSDVINIWHQSHCTHQKHFLFLSLVLISTRG